jgi:hypothetical protein
MLDWSINGMTDGNTLTITRCALGSYSGTTGEYTEGSHTTLTVDAVVYPARPEQLQKLPEGQRSEETQAVITSTELYTSRANNRPADTFSWLGSIWVVVSVSRWQLGAYECLAQRTGQ